MPKCHIVETRRKYSGMHMSQRADIEIAHTITVHGLTACSKDVPGSDHRNRLRKPGIHSFGCHTDSSIVGADTFQQFLLLVTDTFTRLRLTNIAVPQVRHSTHQQLRLAQIVMQQQHLVDRFSASLAHHMYIQCPQQARRCIQERGRVVITANNHHMPTAGAANPGQKTVIQLLGCRARCTGIKNVTSHNQHINVVSADTAKQPVEKSSKLFLASASVQCAPQMPVRSVKDIHKLYNNDLKDEGCLPVSTALLASMHTPLTPSRNQATNGDFCRGSSRFLIKDSRPACSTTGQPTNQHPKSTNTLRLGYGQPCPACVYVTLIPFHTAACCVAPAKCRTTI